MSSSRYTLRRVIIQRVLPIAALAMALVFFATWRLLTQSVHATAERQIRTISQHEAHHFSQNLELLSDVVDNIAAHQIVVNSVFDIDHRDLYLHAFMQSLQLPGPREQRIELLNYRGEVIVATGNLEAHTDYTTEPIPPEGTLVTDEFIIISKPVRYGVTSEATVVATYALNSLLATELFLPTSLLVDNREVWHSETYDAESDQRDWLTDTAPVEGLPGVAVASRAKLSDVYSPMVPLGMGLIGAIAASLICVIWSVWMSSRVARSKVNEFIESISRIRFHQDSRVDIGSDVTQEFARLASHFNAMLSELDSASVSQEKLRQAELRLQEALSGANLVAWDWNLFDGEVHFSPQIVKQLKLDSPWTSVQDWMDALHPDDREQAENSVSRYMAGETEEYYSEFRLRRGDGEYAWIRGVGQLMEDGEGRRVRFVGVNIDITAERKAQEESHRLADELLEASRQAGMAQVATGVLHNVGNILNTVNVSAQVITDQLRNSRVPRIADIGRLLDDESDDLNSFFQDDPRGQQLPGLIRKLGEALERERTVMKGEVNTLNESIDYIREVVSAQQSYAKRGGVQQQFRCSELVDAAIRLTHSRISRDGVKVAFDYSTDPALLADKQLCLQILVNLITNAIQAVENNRTEAPAITVQLAQTERMAQIHIIDNGVGISATNLESLFSHGFTTKTSGHGFGLHSCALAATEMGGQLTASSDGEGCGARFTLSLPRGPRKPGTEARTQTSPAETQEPVLGSLT